MGRNATRNCISSRESLCCAVFAPTDRGAHAVQALVVDNARFAARADAIAARGVVPRILSLHDSEAVAGLATGAAGMDGSDLRAERRCDRDHKALVHGRHHGALQGHPAYPPHGGEPTIAESGVPGSEVVGWMAAFVPKGTPPSVVARLNQVINQAQKSYRPRHS